MGRPTDVSPTLYNDHDHRSAIRRALEANTVTDSSHRPDATPDEATPSAGGERDEVTAATDAVDDAAAVEDAAVEDAVVADAVIADDPGAEASAAASAAAEAAVADGADAEDLDSASEDLDDGLDLEALAEADPRSKAELLGELVVAENKRDEYLDDLRRSHADFENYRRRILREGAAQRDAGKAELAGPLLEVLDDLDRTLQAADGSADPDLAKGVTLVASKFTTTLSKVGLERIDATGVEFDPKVHEAVQQQPADEPAEEPVVVQVLRPGYRLGQRTLRPAMVVVEQ